MKPVIFAAAVLLALPAHADSWKALKDVAKQQASQRAEEELSLPQAATPGAKVYIIEPADGAVVTSPVRVVFGLRGMGVAPAGVNQAGTGHHHLLIDSPEIDYTKPLPATEQIVHFGGGQTETMIELTPGKHTLQLLLADWKHQPHNPAVQSEKITITVK
ncbi:DUF4399 domain-containing protein [Sinimarinibacterium thermocellulolyticum]|uniref:DUF4399 domain-containing protein n=1 Tax=Sinimarinibacterium thermocellulolyticum TaxID=3170016 RepID=A0ABV2A5Q4_9GAMM